MVKLSLSNLLIPMLTSLLIVLLLQACQSAPTKQTSAKPAEPQAVYRETPSQDKGSENKVTGESNVAKTLDSKAPDAEESPEVSNTHRKTKEAVAATKPTKDKSKTVAEAEPRKVQPKEEPKATTASKVPAATKQVAKPAATKPKVSKEPEQKAVVQTEISKPKARPKEIKPAEKTVVEQVAKPTMPKAAAESAAETTELAMLDTQDSPAGQVAEEEAESLQPLKLTLDLLPYAFSGWTLEHNWDNQHPDTCRLRSDKISINDGYETSYLWAEVLPDQIKLHTGSHIDLEYEGSGVQFGFKPAVPFSGLVTETAVQVKGDFVTQLATTSTMTVYIGFWPTWPKTETQKVSLSLDAMTQAVPAFEQCLKL